MVVERRTKKVEDGRRRKRVEENRRKDDDVRNSRAGGMGRISPRPPQSDWGIVGRVGEGVNGPQIVALQEVSCTAAHLDHCTPQRTAEEDGWQGALPLVIRSCLSEDHKHSNPNGKHRNASLGRCRSRYLYLSRALSRACPALPTLSPDATVTGTN